MVMDDMKEFNAHLNAQIRFEAQAELELDEEQDMRQQSTVYYWDATMAKVSIMKRRRGPELP
jgi:hypothetical protein